MGELTGVERALIEALSRALVRQQAQRYHVRTWFKTAEEAHRVADDLRRRGYTVTTGKSVVGSVSADADPAA